MLPEWKILLTEKHDAVAIGDPIPDYACVTETTHVRAVYLKFQLEGAQTRDEHSWRFGD